MAATLLRVAAWIYGTYLAICLLLVLPAMNILAPRLMLEHANRELRSELLLFNPFTFALDLRGLNIREPDGHQPLALDRVLIDLSLSSLWEPGIVLDHAWVRELDLHVLRYDDGRFHFDDLLPDASTPSEADGGEIPAFTIRDLQFEARTLTYTDRTRPGPYETVQRDLNLRKENLTTVHDRSGDGRLELTSDGGGRLSWRGMIDLAASESAGRFEFENIDLTPAYRYEAQALDFVAESALLDLSFDYRASWAGEGDATLRDGVFRLHDIRIRAADLERYPETGIDLADLTVDAIEVSLAEQRASAQTLVLSGLAVSGFDDGDVVSLRDIFVDADAAPAAEEEELGQDRSQGANPDSEAGFPWSVRLGEFSLVDSRIAWRTPYLSPDVMSVSPLAIRAADLAWPARNPSTFGLELVINEQTRLTTSGALNLGTGAGDLATELTTFELAWLHPLIHEQVRTDLERGQFNLTAESTLRDFSPASVALDASIVDLGTVLHETGEEAFSFERFDVQDVDVDVTQEHVRIGKLRLQSPQGSLHILEDGSINVNGIVRSGPSTEENGDASEGNDSSWRVEIAGAELAGGRLDFADDSLPLPFKTMIEAIEASVEDIDSAAETPLKVTLNGNVDGYAPVTIEGSGSPHAEVSDGEVRFRFRGVDIATMSPYSGTYAGYTIASGTLSLDLRYALAGAQIDGDNRIVISQMELGEPVESDLAVEVPLKLGIALLTDAEGVIDLSVPVSGNVDDPQFSLGQVIGKAVMNVITKAVTAPFRLLAGLVGTEEDLENIAFAAGSTALEAPAEDALGSLAQALTQRPQLSLRVVGSSDPIADGAALREEALSESLVAAGLEAESLSARDGSWTAAVEARYAALLASNNEETAAAEDGEPTADATPPSLEEQWQTLIEATELPPNALEDLATARAAAAKRELVTIGGIDAARIAIAFSADDATSGVHMEVDS